MDLKKTLAKRIAKYYGAAVLAIAIAILISQGALQYFLHQLETDSREVNLAGKMRMLSQRTVKLALLIDDQPQFDRYRAQLRDTADELFALFDALRNGSAELGVPAASADAGELFATTAPLLATSLKAADQLLLAAPGSDAFADHLALLLSNDEELLNAIARIPAFYEAANRRQVTQLARFEFALMVITLLILVLALRFLFQPISRIATEALDRAAADSAETQKLRRLAAMGEMSGGVAHELNSPLAAVSFTIQRLQRRLKKGRELSAEELAGQLDNMGADVVRMGEIIQSIRALAAGQLPEPKRRHSADVLFHRGIANFQQRFGQTRLKVSVLPGAEQVTVDGVEYQIEQIITNLLKNASEALAQLPEPWAELSAQRRHEATVITVRDAGSGIPTHIAERIFDPFFTTRQVGEGMGLGLALSQKLAELHGGKLSYEAQGGHTAFLLYLPDDPAISPSARQ